MATPPIRTPGVFVEAANPVTPSIVGVETALPVFVGYTEKAERNGEPCPLVPIRLASLADYGAVFGGAYPYLHALTPVTPLTAGAVMVGSSYYRPDVVQRYDLFNSLRLFYDNGGANCYVVSVGSYQDTPSHEALATGLAAVRDLVGPTMLVAPEAVRLAPAGHAAVVQAMLAQCTEKQDRVAILDVPLPSDAVPDPVAAFRAVIGPMPPETRRYGMAYYPFVRTSLIDPATLGYGSLVPEARATLQAALLATAGDNAALRTLIGKITQVAPDDPAYLATNKSLTAKLPALRELAAAMAAIENVLPPSPAMAGVYTLTDSQRGVWSAPANVALVSVTGPAVKITDRTQRDLNVSLDGLSVNAVRDFVGRGTLVWGARTLDGNSNEWRYIQVRRTLTYVEQSVRRALANFVFEPNAPPTWTMVVAMISSFLRDMWQQGALQGTTPNDAFAIQCGLGLTMTTQDILENRMIVHVMLAMVRPAEFIVLQVEQQLQGEA